MHEILCPPCYQIYLQASGILLSVIRLGLRFSDVIFLKVEASALEGGLAVWKAVAVGAWEAGDNVVAYDDDNCGDNSPKKRHNQR